MDKTSKRKLILDVDTGSDDTIAMMVAAAAKELDVIGICSVFGNLPLQNTTENTLRVMELLKLDIPVYRGCEHSIVRHLEPCRKVYKTLEKPKVDKAGRRAVIHSDFLNLPTSMRKLQLRSAVQFYLDELPKYNHDVTVVLLGACTNLAVAMTANPSIGSGIDEIVVMGGGLYRSNVSSAAEWNIHCDPEAAQIVADSGCKLTFVSLDATHSARLSYRDTAALRTHGTAPSCLAADLIDQMIHAYGILQPVGKRDSAPCHDALAICYLLDSTVLTGGLTTRVDIDFSGGFADGATIVDTRVYKDRADNAYFSLRADEEKFRMLVVDSIKSL